MKILFARLLLLCIFLMPVYILSQEREAEREGSPFDRWKFFHEQRAFPLGEIPADQMKKAQYRTRQMLDQKGGAHVLAQQPAWRLVGPTSVGGRVRSIALHPTKPEWIYIGAANGGIWRSTDAGGSWNALMDFENSSSMGQIEIDHNNPSVLYAATGEDRGGSYGYPGSGIYRSTDDGKTWKVIGLAEVGAFTCFEVHPLNSNLLFAGGANSNPGFYRSENAGSTWERTFNFVVSDMTINPNDQNEVFIGSPGNGIYRSRDAGKTWKQLTVDGQEYGYVTVQLAPSDPKILYALIEGAADKLGYIYKSTNSGDSWSLLYSSEPTFFNGQGSYDIYISVHSNNPNIVLAGGIDVFRSSDGGANWENKTNVYTGGDMHPDQHCAAFLPENPNIVYAGNDGGMMKSTDAGITWEVINNQLAITQYHAFAIDQSKKNLNLGGCQDNGTISNESLRYGDIVGGDGGFTCVDHADPNTVYASTQNGNMYRVSMLTGQVAGINTGIPTTDASLFIAPMKIDYIDSKILYHGRHAVYQTTNRGASWIAISPRFTNTISYVEPSPLNPDYLAAGTDKGDLYISTDQGESWTNVTRNGLPTRYITDIQFSFKEEKTLYVSLSGAYTSHVYKSTDLGATWINISQPLPDISINALALHPENENILFAGADIGVYATWDGGKTWFPYGLGFPNTAVLDMGIFTGTAASPQPPQLRVATHGRTIWESDIPGEAIQTTEIVAPAGGEKFLGGAMEKVTWYGFTLPVRVEYSMDNGQSWNLIADKITENQVLWKIPQRYTFNARIRVSSVNNPTESRITRTFTITELRKGALIQASAVAHLPYGLCYDGRGGLWTTSFNDNYLYKLNSKSLVIEKQVKILQGDSLFADITMDRARGVFFVHRLNSTQGAGGKIVEVDTNGNVLRTFDTPARNYGLGLELIDGKLIATERDGSRLIYVIDPATGKTETTFKNPYQQTYGPRCIAYDGQQNIYQVCTFFPGGGSLSAVYLQKIAKNALDTEVEKMELLGNNGLINARGVEFDPMDNNLWVSSYDGAIYKVAGFETVTVGVQEEDQNTKASPDISNALVAASIKPNPVQNSAFISFTMLRTVGNARLTLHDILGNEISVLYDGEMPAGATQNVVLDSSSLPAGVYTLIFSADGLFHQAEKILIQH